jgi:hypothetical protein
VAIGRELKPLQVRLPATLLSAFKAYAEAQGRSMASLMAGWIEDAVRGGAAGSPVRVEGISDHGSVLAELKRQTELLEALVAGGVVATSSRASSERVSALGGALGSSRHESGYEYESD